MKYLLTLSLASLILFFGCEKFSEPASPESTTPTKQLTLISIPEPAGGLSVEALLTKYQKVDGDDGGYFQASFAYEGGPFGKVYCSSVLVFSPGAFNGVTEIQKTLDSETAVMTFGPSMQFDIPVTFSLKIAGLDLSSINQETLDFVYIAPDGTYQNCEYAYVYMDVDSGTLVVRNAKLNHFSRYGFVN
jgi:hypothetical protein